MPRQLSRRDFLNLSGLSLAALLSEKLLAQPAIQPAAERPNIIILLFDALSARHLSLYGCPRPTTPCLDAFAAECTVYHAHHAAANFTTPSTASLLSGVHPWTHGAYHNLPRPKTAAQNLFQAIAASGAQGAHAVRPYTLIDARRGGWNPPDTPVRPYHRAAFTQNLLADLILDQYDHALDTHLPLDAFSLAAGPLYATANRIFERDRLAATLATQDFLYSTRNRPASPFFSLADRLSAQALHAFYQRKYRREYPYGLPFSYLNNMLFDQRPVFDGLAALLPGLPRPFLAYLHLWSPHEPYRPHQDFVGRFAAHPWQPPVKPNHPLDPTGLSPEELTRQRDRYDEGVAHIDAEFGRLAESLRRSGLLDTSYIIVTSDHGQMFERGVAGHTTPLLYEALLHIPLLVHAPGQTQRQDIHSLTGNLDLLPTLLNLAGRPVPGRPVPGQPVPGQPVPAWAQGQLLPGLGGDPANPQRAVFALDAKEAIPGRPPEYYSAAILKGDHKLILYHYPGYENQAELYNLAEDPEELHDLSAAQPALLQELRSEIITRLSSAQIWDAYLSISCSGKFGDYPLPP